MPRIPTSISQPILLHSQDCLYGTNPDKRFGDTLQRTFEGPSIAVVPQSNSGYPFPNVNVDGLLLNRSGPPWTWIYADLRDSYAWDLDGLTNFEIDFTILRSAQSGEPEYVLSSGGKELSSNQDGSACPRTNAVYIYTQFGALNFFLTTTVGTFFVQTPNNAIPVGQAHQVQCIFNTAQYPGQAVVKINGSVAATKPATGLVVQKPWEWVMLGGASGSYLNDIYGAAFDGRLKDLRLIVGGATIFNAPLTTSYGPFVNYSCGVGPGFLMIRSGYGASSLAFDVSISDMVIMGWNNTGCGIMAVGGVGLRVKNCQIPWGRYGVHFHNNTYLVEMDQVEITSGMFGRVGVMNAGACGVQRFNKVDVTLFPYDMLFAGGSAEVSNSYFRAGYCGIFFPACSDNGMVDFYGCTLTDEDGQATYGMVGSMLKQISWRGGVIDAGISIKQRGKVFKLSASPSGQLILETLINRIAYSATFNGPQMYDPALVP